MAGPNLELFKFSLYLLFPLAVMVHYGDPQWYHDNVLPFRDRFWPDPETLYVRRTRSPFPTSYADLTSVSPTTEATPKHGRSAFGNQGFA